MHSTSVSNHMSCFARICFTCRTCSLNEVTCWLDVNSPLTFNRMPSDSIQTSGRKPEKERQPDTQIRKSSVWQTQGGKWHIDFSYRSWELMKLIHTYRKACVIRAQVQSKKTGGPYLTLSYSLPVTQTFPYLTPTFTLKIFFPSLVCLVQRFKDLFHTRP